jgi:hypothetical protein
VARIGIKLPRWFQVEREFSAIRDGTTRQLCRASLCEEYIRDSDEKKHVVNDVVKELCDSMELLENWGSKATLDAFDRR